jgi:hypothetical protein
MDVDSDVLLKDLYERMVLKYVHESDHDTLADTTAEK